MQEKMRSRLIIPGLDGVRAIAVTCVILFHAGIYNLLPGGYLGVDVFFTLSGFLITSLILNEIESTGSFDLMGFIKRRFKRLYPALLFVIFACCTYSLFFATDSINSIKSDITPAILYYSNYHQLLNELPYFEQFGRPHPFQHLWSLAIEMHFYLVWPIIFLFYGFIKKKYFIYIAFCITVGVALWSLYLALDLDIPLNSKPEKFYFRTDTRISDILWGAFFAFCFDPKITNVESVFKKNAKAIFGVLSIVILGVAFALIDETSKWLYRGGFSVVSLATCFLIVASSSRSGVISSIFNSKYMCLIGKRSYSLYLWHWPVFTYLRAGEELPSNAYVSLFIRLLITGALAELTYRFIEVRFKRSFFNVYGQMSRIVYVSFMVTSLSIIYLIFKSNPSSNDMAVDLPNNDVSCESQNLIKSQDIQPAIVKLHNNYPISLTDIRITAIGDSVMLGARPIMARWLPIARTDAVVGRQASDALKLIKELKSSGDLSNDVLIHVGTNGYIYEQHLKQILDILSDRRTVVIFNVHADRKWTVPNNQLLKRFEKNYPSYVFVDWDSASANHPDFFVKDGIHLTGTGMNAFAKLAKEAFNVPDIPKEIQELQKKPDLQKKSLKGSKQKVSNSVVIQQDTSNQPSLEQAESNSSD
jgi:peptidoglycan/LPS O-acetylase OafA/YrhL